MSSGAVSDREAITAALDRYEAAQAELAALSFDVLTTYADYIPEQETENPLPEPVAPASVDTGNVVNLHRSTAG
jgi:hypothetical protein